jgi:hypothetical protein
MHLNKTFPRSALSRRGLAALAGTLACAAGTLAAAPAAMAAARPAVVAASYYAPQFNGVSALSPADAWAIGSYGGGGAPPITRHWNGTSWTAVKAPDPGGATGSTTLFAVSAGSAADAWAVGYYRNPITNANGNSLALHWTGTSWKKVATPSPGGASGDSVLNSVTAISPTDAWAVGWYSATSGQSQPFVLHWNGTSWQQVTVPAPGGTTGRNDLTSVSADSSSDVWATGYSATTTGATGQSYVLHWNGTTWEQVTSPDPGGSTGLSFLVSVHAISASDAWAVGYYSTTSGGQQSFTAQWNGTSWQQVTSPDPGGSTGLTDLVGVSATSANDVWAVGSYQASGKYAQSLVLHWTGTSWKKAGAPSPGGATHSTNLTGVSADSATDAWASGYHFTDGGATASVLLHWNGTKWAKVTA